MIILSPQQYFFYVTTLCNAYKFITHAFHTLIRTIRRFIHADIISKSAVFQRVPLGNKMSLNIEQKQQDTVNKKN